MTSLPTTIAIRRASPLDTEAAVRIVLSALVEHGITPEPEGRDRGVFGFGRRGGRFRDLVAMEGETMLGLAALEPWDDVGFVSKLFARPEARGRGVGWALLDATAEEARALGMTGLALTTRPVFRAAITLYERYGFVRDPSHEGGDLLYRRGL